MNTIKNTGSSKMTNEIKERISKIRNGEVPKGYVKSKLGIAPEDWEEIKFSSLFESDYEYTEDLTQFPLYSLTIEDGITAKTERYERSHLVKKNEAYKVLKTNNFAFNPMNARFGAIARNKEPFSVAVSGYYDIFSVKNPADIEFMESFLVSDSMIKYYNKVSTGSIIEKQRVHFSQFIEFQFKMPPADERKKISEILSTQDKAIALEERCIEELKKLKKAYLQKMFPKKGEVYPEIRFKGFTNAWEQRKVGDVLSESRDAGHSGDIAKKLTVKLWGKGVYAKNDKGSAATQYFVRHAGQFIYSKLDFLNSAFGVVPKELENYESTADLPAFDCVNINPYFMFYRAIQPSFYLSNGMIADGSRKAKRIHVETFLDMPLELPSNEEQQKIANHFLNLDHLITLHQRKLEEEKQKKKALMQMLLTGIVRVKL